jgi:hypothetical protein
MPYHERGAYSDGRCYELTEKDLGENMPPQASQSLRLPEIAAVADYVIAAIQGRGEATLDECLAFWGGESKMCNIYRAATPASGASAAGADGGTKP